MRCISAMTGLAALFAAHPAAANEAVACDAKPPLIGVKCPGTVNNGAKTEYGTQQGR